MFRPHPHSTRPPETTISQTFVQQKETVPLPAQSLNAVSLSAAQEKQRRLEGDHLKLCSYHAGQTANPTPQICIATGDVHRAIAVEVIQHERKASTRTFRISGVAPL